MSWLQTYAPAASEASPFEAAWHADLPPLQPNGDWPEALAEVLFAPTFDDLTTYAVIDAARVPNLPDLLAASGLDHACLFDGKAAEELATVAPWLVMLDPDSRFTRNLWTDSKAPWHLWGTECCILLQSPMHLSDLRRHLRHFTRLEHADKGWHYLRYWQGDIMGALAMLGPFDLMGQLFAADGIHATLLPTEGSILALRPKAGATPHRAVPRLDTPTWDAMGRAVEYRFHHRLVQACVAQDAVPESYVRAVVDHLRDWGFTGRDALRTLALWWTSGAGAHLPAQPWIQDELKASHGMPDAIRADRLRNLAEDMEAKGMDHAAG